MYKVHENCRKPRLEFLFFSLAFLRVSGRLGGTNAGGRDCLLYTPFLGGHSPTGAKRGVRSLLTMHCTIARSPICYGGGTLPERGSARCGNLVHLVWLHPNAPLWKRLKTSFVYFARNNVYRCDQQLLANLVGNLTTILECDCASKWKIVNARRS